MGTSQFRDNGEAGVEIKDVDFFFCEVGDEECGVERLGDGGGGVVVGTRPEIGRVACAGPAEGVDPL